MANATLYTTSECVSCKALKAWIVDNSLDVDIKNATDDYRVANALKAAGIRRVPALMIDGEWVVGLGKIRECLKSLNV